MQSSLTERRLTAEIVLQFSQAETRNEIKLGTQLGVEFIPSKQQISSKQNSSSEEV